MFTYEAALAWLFDELRIYPDVKQERLAVVGSKCIINNTHMMLRLPSEHYQAPNEQGTFYTLDKTTHQLKMHALTKEAFATEVARIKDLPEDFAPTSRLLQRHREVMEQCICNYTPEKLCMLEMFQWFLNKHPEFVYQRIPTVVPTYRSKTDIIKIDKTGVTVNDFPISFEKFYQRYSGYVAPTHEIEQYRDTAHHSYYGDRYYQTKCFTLLVNKLNVYWFNKCNLTQGKYRCKDRVMLRQRLTDFITFDDVVALSPPVKPMHDFQQEILQHLISDGGGAHLLMDHTTLAQLEECLNLMSGYTLSKKKSDGSFTASVPGFSVVFDGTGQIYYHISNIENLKVVETPYGKTIEWVNAKRGKRCCYAATKAIKALKELHHKSTIQE